MSLYGKSSLKKYLVVYTMKILLLICLCIISAHAVKKTATKAVVRWSDPNSWSPNGIPNTGDNVIIPNGSDVIFDAATPR
jgi:hypothetical protein